MGLISKGGSSCYPIVPGVAMPWTEISGVLTNLPVYNYFHNNATREVISETLVITSFPQSQLHNDTIFMLCIIIAEKLWYPERVG